jgi:hypothetical protein
LLVIALAIASFETKHVKETDIQTAEIEKRADRMKNVETFKSYTFQGSSCGTL